MFEEAERQVLRAVDGILKIPITIGVPDANWKKQYGYPMGCVMLGSVKIVDWIEDGCPETEKDEGDDVVTDYAVAEAEMVFDFHLATRKKIILDQLTMKFLAGISKMPYIGRDNEYQVGAISFRDVLPEPEGERVFERIFSIPVSGTITETVVETKGNVEFIGNVSENEEVLNED